MTEKKSWTELLGKPQGNEYVYESDIVREVSLHQFRILWSFGSEEVATECFNAWLKENEK